MIKVMNCRAEEAPLEGLQADLIVSEWMGYILLFERMLPSVLAVRDKCLIPRRDHDTRASSNSSCRRCYSLDQDKSSESVV